MDKPIKITALTPEELALLLSRASRKNISAQDVLAIARTAGIVSAAGTINLIEFTAFLAKETSVGEN
jgi:molybdenum cofactor biosynthesis enzyme